MSKRTYHLILPSEQVTTAEYEGELEFGCIPFARMREMLGFAKGTLLEHVNALWHGKRAHMFVDEEGLLRNPPLAFNKKATRIYWNATLAREAPSSWQYHNLQEPADDDDVLNELCDREDFAPIAGPALLWEGDLE